MFNWIDNDEKTISDRNDRYRSEKVCKDLTYQFGLYFAPGKEQVNIHRLREPEKTKYQIYEALKARIPDCKNWDDLIERLNKGQTTVEFKFKGKTSEVQGVTFMMNGHSFSGTKVDRQFSFSKITAKLKMNQGHEVRTIQQPKSYEPGRSVLGNYLGGLILNIDRQAEWERRGDQKINKSKIKRSKGLKR